MTNTEVQDKIYEESQAEQKLQSLIRTCIQPINTLPLYQLIGYWGSSQNINAYDSALQIIGWLNNGFSFESLNMLIFKYNYSYKQINDLYNDRRRRLPYMVNHATMLGYKEMKLMNWGVKV